HADRWRSSVAGDAELGRIGKAEIEKTREVIRPYVRVTPVLGVSGKDFGLGEFPITLKLELLQHSGSFKVRGAFTNLLTRAIPAAGVVAASGGNHGTAVAYAAMRLGARVRIFVPTVSSPAKIARIRAYGAELEVGGALYADALAPRRVGELMFPIARAHVVRVLLVEDAAIRRAQEALWNSVRIVAEPGGAAAFAALLSGVYTPAPGERVGVIVCGGN